MNHCHYRNALVLIVCLIVAIATPTAGSAQIVSFNPSDTVPIDPSFDVVIDIDCGGLDVKGVELSVTYDPLLVRLDGVSAGGWYSGSGQSFTFFDYTNIEPQGTIHFASAVLSGTLSGSGNLAVCHFAILDFGVSPLNFVETDVRGLQNTDLGFSHSTGDQITLDPVVEVRQRTFGNIKTLYR